MNNGIEKGIPIPTRIERQGKVKKKVAEMLPGDSRLAATRYESDAIYTAMKGLGWICVRRKTKTGWRCWRAK